MYRLLPCLLIWSFSASAQTVEYEIPSSYELISGRLSVTFVEDVPLERELVLMDSLGLAVVETVFRAVRATVRFEAPPGPEELAALRNAPLMTAVIPVTKGSFASGIFDLELAPHATRDDVDRAVARAGSRPVEHFEKPPNELVIKTREGDEETAQLKLEQLREVRYVSYIHRAR